MLTVLFATVQCHSNERRTPPENEECVLSDQMICDIDNCFGTSMRGFVENSPVDTSTRMSAIWCKFECT